MTLYLGLRIFPGLASEPTRPVTLPHGCVVLSDGGFCGADGKGMSPKEEWPRVFILSGWHIPVWQSNFSPVIT